MLKKAERIFSSAGIEYADALPFSMCRVINEGKIKRLGFEPATVIIFAVPYLYELHCDANISVYAAAEDYHLFFRELFEALVPELSALFPEGNFAVFADNSPIDERDAAAKAQIGVIGENRLLITEKYSSFVFLGEIITDLPADKLITLEDFTVRRCRGCGKCAAACPSPDSCLSAITQKKGELSEEEERLIKASGCAWGCDICQLVCPCSEKINPTPVDFFKKNLIFRLTSEEIKGMSKPEFSRRAYAWRGKKTILRNIELLEKL